MKTGRRADTRCDKKGAATVSMNKKYWRLLAITVAGACVLSSCQQFFTTSLAPMLARDSYTIPADMSVDDATALLADALANGDAEMAAALVTPLLAAATTAAADPTSAAYQEAANALLDAAVLSSGVGSVMTEVATTLATADLESMTEEDLAETMDLISSITLDDNAEAALILIAQNPPDDMTADDAYAAALALASNAFVDAGVSFDDIGSLSAEEEAALAADPAVDAAIALLDQASLLGGDESLFGSLLSGVDLTGF